MNGTMDVSPGHSAIVDLVTSQLEPLDLRLRDLARVSIMASTCSRAVWYRHRAPRCRQ
jgi:hypothetical protein